MDEWTGARLSVMPGRFSVRDKFIAAIALALAKFRFKHFSPIRETSDIGLIAEIWVDNLIAEKVTQQEVTLALNWLMANKPEFPDIADVLDRVRRKRSKDYSRLMDDNIAIERSPGVIGIVPINSPEGQAEIARREQVALPEDISNGEAVLKSKLNELAVKFAEPLKREKEYAVREFVEDSEGEAEARAKILAQVSEL